VRQSVEPTTNCRQEETQIAQPYENKSIDNALVLLATNGFGGLTDAVTLLLNSTMIAERSEYLGAASYEPSVRRGSYADGFKDKTLKIRLGSLPLRVSQPRHNEFYPKSE